MCTLSLSPRKFRGFSQLHCFHVEEMSSAEFNRCVWLERHLAKSYFLLFCFLNNLSELRILITFHYAKNDHRWVTKISLKTITAPSGPPLCAADLAKSVHLVFLFPEMRTPSGSRRASSAARWFQQLQNGNSDFHDISDVLLCVYVA